jgi:predicted acylesterase/phospholipase RssA
VPGPARKQLRLALALNGGVSLAVWMGGIVDELLRFCRGAGPYGPILSERGEEVRIDVISGASAGGLNGVFLALGLVYRHQHLTPLRDLWIDAAGFERLFRSPYDPSAPSLLDGDGYFLNELSKAVELLMNGEAELAEKVPIDLTLAVTSLSGEPRALPDDFGGVITDVRHDAQLHFERGQTERDDFKPDASTDRAKVVERLARAGRSSASFPGAFEPSFVDVGDKGLFKLDQVVGLSVDRYLVDGGVLVNLPVEPAIEAIHDQAADGPVTRVMGIVVPDPSLRRAATPDEEKRPPGVRTVVSLSTGGIPRQQSVARFLDELDEHNIAVRVREAQRLQTVQALMVDQLKSFSKSLFEVYRAGRIEGSKAKFATDVCAKIGLKWPAGRSITRSEAETAFSAAKGAASLPWVPETFGATYGWGASTVRRIADLLIHLLNHLTKECGLDTGALKLRVHEQRQLAAGILRDWPIAEKTFDTLAHARPANAPDLSWPNGPALRRAATETLKRWPGDPDGRQRLAVALLSLGHACRDMVDLIPANASDPLAYALKERLAGMSAMGCRRWLLAVEVVENAFIGFEDVPEQRVELMQISSTSAVDADPLARATAAEKLGGTELGHFGGFLKGSWRANDWMWGRLDATTFIASVLKEPQLAMQAQVDVLRDELPVVAREAERDIALGAEPNTAGADFAVAYRSAKETAKAEVRSLSDEELIALLGRCRVGEESVDDELGSEMATRMLTSGFAAAANTVVMANPPVLRNVARLVRWFALVLWAIARTAGRSRRVGSALIGALFGIGIVGATIDTFTSINLGVLAFPVWLVLLAGAGLALWSAPAVAVPLVVLAVLPGLLHSLPKDEWSWWPEQWVWPRIEQGWVPPVAFVLALLMIGGLREWAWVRWVRMQLRRGIGGEADLLRRRVP